jgi:hypothetical protein
MEFLAKHPYPQGSDLGSDPNALSCLEPLPLAAGGGLAEFGEAVLHHGSSGWMVFIFLCAVFISLSCAASSLNSSPRICVGQQDIRVPAAFSCIAVDLKLLAQGKIKILEMGPADVSGFSGYKAVTKKEMEYILYAYAESLGLKVYPMNNPSEGTSEFASILFPRRRNFDPQDLSTYSAVLMNTCALARDAGKVQEIAQHYPYFLIMNYFEFFLVYLRDKFISHLIFMDGFADYRPKWKLLPAEYSPGMAGQIIQEIPSPRYLIKPLCEAQGIGIIPVEAHQLNGVLKEMLTQKAVTMKPSIDEYRDDPYS